MMEYILRNIVFFFNFQCKYPNARLLDKIIWLSQVHSLAGSKIQILLPKHLSQIFVHILLKSLILFCCENNPVLSSERVFVLFHLARVLIGIMMGLTQSNKEGENLALFLP